jgi:cytochrome c biogenesis protein ResB
LPSGALTLERFEAVYEEEIHPVEYRADFRYDSPPRDAEWITMRVNEPWAFGGTHFILNRQGFSPRFQLWDENENLRFDQYVNLSVMGYREDSFEAPELGLRLELTFYPDFSVDEEGRAVSLTSALSNPAFHARILRRRTLLYEGFLHQGRSVAFPSLQPGHDATGEYRVLFSDVRRWVSLRVVRELGLFLLFVSFFGGTAALGVRFWDYERRLWIERRGGELLVRGHSPHCPALFEEEFEEEAERLLETPRPGEAPPSP